MLEGERKITDILRKSFPTASVIEVNDISGESEFFRDTKKDAGMKSLSANALNYCANWKDIELSNILDLR